MRIIKSVTTAMHIKILEVMGWKSYNSIETLPKGTFKARLEDSKGKTIYSNVKVHTDTSFPFWQAVLFEEAEVPVTSRGYKVTHYKL